MLSTAHSFGPTPIGTARSLASPIMIATAPTSFEAWPSQFDNSLLRELRAEANELDPHSSRQVLDAHFTRVPPTVTAPAPTLVAYSASVAYSLGLDAKECESEAFLRAFSGSPPAGDFDSWATVYGASFFGRFGGQRGDGRAISIGQVAGSEIQLKGAGRTPYSRRSDGRAVLRSSVREFLAQEAMAALRVPTTRSLCLVTTGEVVRRYWYTDDGEQSVKREPGAVGTRVATSFLRFGQMEIFAERGDLDLLRELAEHALGREYAHLKMEEPLSCQALERMFDEICGRQALLVAEWLRVGYCQGNMNSDNAALGGVTLDYGPFAFMEKYATNYNPWVGGGLEYSYGMQPTAASKNLDGLSKAFAALAGNLASAGAETGVSDEEETRWLSGSFGDVAASFDAVFRARHADNCRAKLGLAEWDDEAQRVWGDLIRLMNSRSGHRAAAAGAATATSSTDGRAWRMPWASRDPLAQPDAVPEPAVAAGIDFTLLFRTLGRADIISLDDDAAKGFAVDDDGQPSDALRALLQPAALDAVESWPEPHLREWAAWARRYSRRVASEARGAERLQEMANANPKYILRNWMAAAAYEAAERGDYSVMHELQGVLASPYDEQSDATAARWAQVTPAWARDKAGLAFMT